MHEIISRILPQVANFVILYSYLMGVDAIDQTICPEVRGMTKCSIAWGLRPNAIEHLVIPSTEEQIVWSIVSTPIK
jgi:hypothetical protein